MSENNPYILENENVSVDLSMLYEISGGDEEYINIVVKTFLNTMPENLQKIEQGIQNQNWEDVYKSAHYVKSPLSVIKVSEMFEWVLQVESGALNKTFLEVLPGLVQKLKQKFDFAEVILHQKLGQNVQ